MKKFTKMWAIAACALFAGTAAVNAEDYTWKFVTAGDATTYVPTGRYGPGDGTRRGRAEMAYRNVRPLRRWQMETAYGKRPLAGKHTASFWLKMVLCGRLELMRAACRGQTMVSTIKS